ncbi:hypothetical protein BDN72DRAFT_108993 [Pluteus cervinus]|uniref:Uncharacterized protein n=1 Tax=Pluteus cervinus TaxID=181527 RepID=A0ACD3AQS5_9AGAR|nr:hypothetical protein BDN72DRAFT_108993 [Pluteus cervinus]
MHIHTEELATKFYKKVLRAHRETLQALVVDITLPGPWFLQSSNIEDLFVCQKLEKLAIALYSPKDAIPQDLLDRALDLRKWMACLYQLSILETADDWIRPEVSLFDIFITAFRGKGPSIMALGKRQTRFKIRFEEDGNEKVLRYQKC